MFSLRLEDTYMKYCHLISRSQGSIPYVMMIREYCDLVAQYANLNHSPIIRACLDYIDFFYRDSITFRDGVTQYRIYMDLKLNPGKPNA